MARRNSTENLGTINIEHLLTSQQAQPDDRRGAERRPLDKIFMNSSIVARHKNLSFE
jgi:hypothetical protein